MNQARPPGHSARLFASALAGDQDALASLLRIHRGAVLAAARRYLGRRPLLLDVHEPEDAVQGALDDLLERRRFGRLSVIATDRDLCRAFRRSLSAWIRKNSDLEAAAKRRGAPSAAGDRTPHPGHATGGNDVDHFASSAPGAEAAAISDETVDRLTRVLSAREAAVAALRLEGLSLGEIAKHLCLSPRTVDQVVHDIKDVWRWSGLTE
jgi:RNA polymerase sigma factor (sigma-70 family)